MKVWMVISPRADMIFCQSGLETSATNPYCCLNNPLLLRTIRSARFMRCLVRLTSRSSALRRLFSALLLWHRLDFRDLFWCLGRKPCSLKS